MGLETKDRIRERAKANRVGVSVDHDRICQGLARFLSRSVTGWTVVYAALPGEPDVGGLAGLSVGPLALTRTPGSGNDLTVHAADGRRERHRFGFEQPLATAPMIDDADIEAVLVPGLAFDRHGGRLGFGAGYYDRFLGRLGNDVFRIGVSDGFIVERIPTEAHDVAMTHLATEAGVVPLPLA